ncbi:hypothetical protein PPL_11329 [Heterostelium album PN500]|uniref:Uncharacterized protein n=1 Tax=Heterostelium pallidum (strain ATCC 26659 / Pp 5 / PN500) TaxID=670386 RepID=D3BT37_HETP5|nr:hypothetical protein PPL_11329 [Heterostelium album PN500]EFA75254.1 hypothetical protein PPL_11329 [Heterostelium album PN500]|eukprot:XP_020427388.1 hypothetical protein PPL_11329 [Heterostelium album PN500]
MFQWLIEPTTYLMFAIALTIIYVGCKRSYHFHAENDIQDQFEQIPKYVYLLMPLFSSIVLLAFFYYLNEMYTILSFMTSCLSVFAVAFVVYPVFDYLSISSTLIKKIKLGDDTVEFTFKELFSGIVGLIFMLSWRYTNNHFFVNGITSLTFLRINSLLTISLLLSAFLVYDVFWVFQSKTIFGESVMESVAIKVISLPMSISLPLCLSEGWTGLGNGDIALPGVFICQLYNLDLFYGFALNQKSEPYSPRKMGYFRLSLVFYLVGLLVSYTAVSISKKGQPALLYIVVAYSRGHLQKLMKPLPSNHFNQLRSNTLAEDTIPMVVQERSIQIVKSQCDFAHIGTLFPHLATFNKKKRKNLN